MSARRWLRLAVVAAGFALIARPLRSQTIQSGTSFGAYSVDAAVDAREPSIAADQNGNLHLAYYDDSDHSGGGLFYSSRTAAGNWNPLHLFAQGVAAGTLLDLFQVPVDPSGVSLALGVDGSVHVAFESNNGLCYAKLNAGVLVSSTVVDAGPTGASFVYTSIAVDGAGHPRIAYSASTGSFDYVSTTFTGTGGSLQYAWFDGAAWNIRTLDAAAKINISGNGNSLSPPQDATNGRQLSLALDAAGYAHIAYFDDSGPALRYGSYDGTAWTREDIPAAPSQIAGDVLSGVSLALDGSGNPHVSYMDYTGTNILYLAAKSGASWLPTTEVLGYQTTNPQGPSWGPEFSSFLSLDGVGNAAIAFEITPPSSPRWTGFAWQQSGSFKVQVIDQSTSAYSGSMALDGAGNPHLAYSDSFDLSGPLPPPRSMAPVEYASAPAAAFSFSPPMGGSAGGKAQAPDQFSAVATSYSVTWSWAPHSSNATGFRLFEASTSTGPFRLVADTGVLGPGSNSFLQTGLSPLTSYYAYVAAVNAGGVVTSSGTSVATLAPPVTSCTGPFVFSYTDALAARKTVVRAQHLNELRSDIDSLRRDAGLSNYAWSGGSTVSPEVSVIRGRYFREALSALQEVYNKCGQAFPPNLLDDASIVDNSTVITVANVQELRTAVSGAK